MSFDSAELRSKPITELVAIARDLHIDNAASLRRQELLFEILRSDEEGGPSEGEGVLEILPDGFGFLRSIDFSFVPGPDDIYVSPSQIRRFNLRTGDLVRGQIRAPRGEEKYFALIRIESVNETSPDKEREKLLFCNLTPVPPSDRVVLEPAGPTARMVDLVAPVALGQRVVVTSPLRAGRSELIRSFVEGFASSNPSVERIVLLVDERPEEAVFWAENLPAQVVTSTIEDPATRHVQVAEMALGRAQRLVEQGRDVLFVVDSLTRLLRAYNAAALPGGRQISGVVDQGALYRVRRFFGAGRATREGGSLTLVATVLTGTGARIDEVLAEDLSGLGNAELMLDASLADAGCFPALALATTHSSRIDSALDGTMARRIRLLRSQMSGDAQSDYQWLMQLIDQTSDNDSLLAQLDNAAAVGK